MRPRCCSPVRWQDDGNSGRSGCNGNESVEIGSPKTSVSSARTVTQCRPDWPGRLGHGKLSDGLDHLLGQAGVGRIAALGTAAQLHLHFVSPGFPCRLPAPRHLGAAAIGARL